jgi:hypothetical protein
MDPLLPLIPLTTHIAHLKRSIVRDILICLGHKIVYTWNVIRLLNNVNNRDVEKPVGSRVPAGGAVFWWSFPLRVKSQILFNNEQGILLHA